MVVVQLDFNTAFTSTNLGAVYRTLEAYGVPELDVALVKRMQEGSWYSVANPFGETAACELRKGMRQGCPGSPPFYLTSLDPLIRTLSATGKGWRLHRGDQAHGSARECSRSVAARGTESDPIGAIVDDIVVVTVGQSAVADACSLVSVVELWESWLGPSVNLGKSSVAAIDYATNRIVDTGPIRYRSLQLPVQPPDQPFRYLGMLLTVTLNYDFEKERVLQATKERVMALSNAKFLSPSQRELVVQLSIVSLFRYTAGLVPWTFSELENLTRLWVRGYRGAWGLPNSTDDLLFRVSRRYGGRGCLSALGVWMMETTSLIGQCMRKPGVISLLMLDELRRACVSRGCQTPYQLQRILRLVPTESQKSRMDLLLSRLDAVGLDATGVPWDKEPRQYLLVSEALWTQHQSTQSALNVNSEGLRQSLTTVGKLASAGIWFAAQLSAGPGRWLSLRALPSQVVTESEYEALLALLSTSSCLERIAGERSVVPGSRQLTLWEAADRSRATQPVIRGTGVGDGGRLRPVDHFSAGIGRSRRPHPWQVSPRLPDAVAFDLTSDLLDFIPAPTGWELLRRNGRLPLRAPSGFMCQLEAAQATMLELMNIGLDQATFLSALSGSCQAQQRRDERKSVHWSRHLLACIARITGARGLIGCCLVTYHPHYWWFTSLDEGDVAFGSQGDWPAESCVLILDSYPPAERRSLLSRAFGHPAHVWVLRLAE